MLDSRFRDKTLVLVVDDDANMRFLVREALEGADFEIAEAGSGKQGVEAYRRWRPDLVLLDVVMPGMDGFAVCGALRESAGGEHTPILMMTGLDDVESIKRAYEVGATDFVTKPLNYLILGHRLRYMLRAQWAMEKLRASERRLANTQRIARLGSWEWLVGTQGVRFSREAQEVFGLGSRPVQRFDEVLMAVVHPDDRELFKRVFELASGEGRPVSFEHRLLLDDGSVRVVRQEGEIATDEVTGKRKLAGTVQDITERKNAEQQIFQLVNYDSLTGLPNRTYFKRYARQVLEQRERSDCVMAILSLDLDQFKRINDTLGREAGDGLLQQVGERLSKCTRTGDVVARTAAPALSGQEANPMVARLDGDEFMILVTDMHRPEDAALVAQRVMHALAGPFMADGKEMFVTASIGIVIYPLNGTNIETLLNHAESAMHHAKVRGRNCYQFYSESINARARELLALESHLCRALERNEFELHYQPKVDVLTGRAAGAEALIRWRHPDQRLVPPAQFIPLAEEMGLILPIGEWALRAACLQAKLWQEQDLEGMRVAVNLSARQFRERSLVATVRRILAETGLQGRYLELEITEGVVMQDMHTSNAILAELRAMGVHIALDDFGTGYSSLSYLTRFPIDTLKIDQLFVRDINTQADSAAVVSSIIALSRSLELSVVAEGVETHEQLEFLRAHDCHIIQGFYFSQALPANALAAWLEDRVDGIAGVSGKLSGLGDERPRMTDAVPG